MSNDHNRVSAISKAFLLVLGVLCVLRAACIQVRASRVLHTHNAHHVMRQTAVHICMMMIGFCLLQILHPGGSAVVPATTPHNKRHQVLFIPMLHVRQTPINCTWQLQCNDTRYAKFKRKTFKHHEPCTCCVCLCFAVLCVLR